MHPAVPASRAPLLAALLASAVLGGAGITWGLPGMLGWAADELTPVRVLSGMRHRFSAGWHDPYPPFHFYVLAGAYAPVLAADSRPLAEVAQEGWRRRSGEGAYFALFVAGRLVSLAMALGALAALYAAARALAGPAAALWAVLIASLSLPFPYYAKIANVDVAFTFWFALALLGYVRALRSGALADGMLFAVAAALSVAAKDQAYALHVLPAAHLLLARREGSGEGRGLSLKTILLCAAAAAGAFLLASGIVFNPSGFRAHVDVLTGPMNRSLQMFGRTPAGYAAMTALTARLLVFCLGVPAALACAAGLALAWRRGERTLLAVAVLPCVSYFLFFMCAALVAYDRYLLPVVLALSIAGGRFVALALGAGTTLRWAGRGLAAAILAVGLARCVAVDLALVRDARYAAEDWMAAHLPRDADVGVNGPLATLPRVHGLRWTQHASLAGSRADVVVLTTDYAAAARERGDAETSPERIARELGYTAVFRHRGRLAWPLDLGWWIEGLEPYTNLHKVNPEVTILARPGYLPSSSSRSLRGTEAAFSSTASRMDARRRSSASRSASSPSAMMATARCAALAAPMAPTPTVATGTPGGIWTVERSASKPCRGEPARGTPITGSVVWAATAPARWAAPPAAAMITSMPRPRASRAKRAVSSGLRCAESTRRS
jgi:4-amino-4-deoxy-L-arabinose transferase-like glycosyltransferase